MLGEQRKRGYDWQGLGIDPTNHRFGFVDHRGNELSVKQALQPELDVGGQVRLEISDGEIYR